MSKTRLSSSRASTDAVRPALNCLSASHSLASAASVVALPPQALRHHQRPQRSVRGQHAVKPDEVQPRPRHWRGQPLQTLLRRDFADESVGAGGPLLGAAGPTLVVAAAFMLL